MAENIQTTAPGFESVVELPDGTFENPFGGTVPDQKTAEIVVEDYNASIASKVNAPKEPAGGAKPDETKAPSAEKPAPAAGGKQPDGSLQQPDFATSINDAEINSAKEQLEAARKRASEMSQALIGDIQRRYAVRQKQMEDLNKRYLGAQTILGETSGRQRYAPEIQTGILASEERAGLARLAELDAEEAAAITQAQSAQSEKDFDMMYKSMNMVQDLRDKKNQLLQKQYENALRFDDQVIQRARAAREDQEFGFKEEDRKISSLAGVLDKATPEEIARVAAEKGIDPNRLKTAIQEHTREFEKDRLDLAGKYASIAKDLKAGETYTDPLSGLKIVGTKRDEVELTKTIAGIEYKVKYDVTDPANPKELYKLEIGPRWKDGVGKGSGDTDTTPDAALVEAVEYLDKLKKKGLFNDLNYGIVVNAYASTYGADPEKVKSAINEALSKKEIIKSIPPKEIRGPAEILASQKKKK